MVAQTDFEALKAYVTAPGNSGANRADSTVLLHVTHSNLKAKFLEIRFDLSVSATDYLALNASCLALNSLGAGPRCLEAA
jgi:hypothetical protein